MHYDGERPFSPENREKIDQIFNLVVKLYSYIVTVRKAVEMDNHNFDNQIGESARVLEEAELTCNQLRRLVEDLH